MINGMIKKYFLTIGTVFVLMAFLEFVYREPFNNLLRFTFVHNLFHWIFGFIFLALAARANEKILSLALKVWLPLAALIVIAVYFFPARVSDLLGYPVNWFYKLIYLGITAVGIAVMVIPKKEQNNVSKMV